MPKHKITEYLRTPATIRLCEIYGPYWGGMEFETRTAIIVALSLRLHGRHGQSQVKEATLDKIFPTVATYGGSCDSKNQSLIDILKELDREIVSLPDKSFVASLLTLISGVTASTPPPLFGSCESLFIPG